MEKLRKTVEIECSERIHYFLTIVLKIVAVLKKKTAFKPPFIG